MRSKALAWQRLCCGHWHLFRNRRESLIVCRANSVPFLRIFAFVIKSTNWETGWGPKENVPNSPTTEKALYSSDSFSNGKWSSQEIDFSHSSQDLHERRVGLLGKRRCCWVFPKRSTFGFVHGTIIKILLMISNKAVHSRLCLFNAHNAFCSLCAGGPRGLSCFPLLLSESCDSEWLE